MIDDLTKNAHEFLDSGEDNLNKQRFNAAATDFFKAIVILCDSLIYNEIRTLPKNHNERFRLLNIHFNDIYHEVSSLFNLYKRSYNLRLTKEDTIKLKHYANELKSKTIKE